jgi:hypothetical protein
MRAMANTISDEYRRIQADLHASPKRYGEASQMFAPFVAKFVEKFGVSEILDYGAGKGTLGQTLATIMPNHPVTLHHFEPAIAQWATPPQPAEMVTCIDVLEHIEPNYLDAVLDDLQRLALRFGFFTVHCGPAKKSLPDGRNAHLIQQPADWWLPQIMSRFDLLQFAKTPYGFWVVVEHKPAQPVALEPVES